MKSITQFGSIIFSAKLNDDIINEIKGDIYGTNNI